jgi:hypothetical protein
MGWSEHSAGRWGLSILSRFGVDQMYTNTSPALGRAMPHTGDVPSTRTRDGSKRLVNEGFPSLA